MLTWPSPLGGGEISAGQFSGGAGTARRDHCKQIVDVRRAVADGSHYCFLTW
ncbi:MAG: hypothetical protein L0Y42_10220 [Phycisphaerales bacterium]|nr:hypothetical protein [Phycisphaerales bacterium]